MKQQKVSISKIALYVLERLKRSGIDEVLAYLSQLAGKQIDKNFSHARLMVEVAKHVQSRYPVAALEIVSHAMSLEPDMIDAMLIAGLIQDGMGHTREARDHMARVIESPRAKPEHVLMAANLLVRLENKNRGSEAAFKAFDKLDRPLRWADAVLYIAMKVADWQRVDELTRQLAEAHHKGQLAEAREKPRNNVMWCADEAINIEVLKNWSDTEIKPKITQKIPVRPQPMAGRRLRIGYLSSDFREHPTSRLINGLLRHHDFSRFELFLYCSGWDDKSDMRKELLSHCENIHTVTHLSDEEAANLIQSHHIDVLVELNGPTRSHRMGILAHRPAPVQIDYLGWPGSVGGNVVDYVVGDSYTVPNGVEQMYPEKVLRIEKVYQVNDYASLTLGSKPDRKKIGLPDDGRPVIGMFNSIIKVRFEVWQVWMNILKNVPEAVLWILDPGPQARRNIARWTHMAGVEVKRVIAAPAVKHQAHLDRLQCCDLMLDPWPYGGHTSTSDALFAGVPVIALEGSNFAGRVSGALLKAAGLGALVCKNKQTYVRLAVNLLRNENKIYEIKTFLKEKVPGSDVFDAQGKARQFEVAYEHMVRRSLEGLPPVHLNIHENKVIETKANQAGLLEDERAVLQVDDSRLPLVLVCGPWGSGTSAVAGLLAEAGLQAPGPYVKVNDLRTSETYEMKAFQEVLRELASEKTLQKTIPATTAFQRLRQFRNEVLRPAIDPAQDAPPLMLKHGLAPLFLPELCALFAVRIVGVLRSFEAIEATRIRRNWHTSLGRQGAEVIYRILFDHLVNADTPFHLVRYPSLLADSAVEFDKLLAFCGVVPTEAQRQTALAFVNRPVNYSRAKE